MQERLDRCYEIITEVFPELRGRSCFLLGSGWHSDAIEVDGWIFKFPKNAEAVEALKKEAEILKVIRPSLTLTVPDLLLIERPEVFSRHAKIPGNIFLRKDYLPLSKRHRDHLAEDLALFYAELHAIPRRVIPKELARPVNAIGNFQNLEMRMPLLTATTGLQDFVLKGIERFRQLRPDPAGEIFGFFDGHGWNMAFDFSTQRLNGIFDFADSGLGDRHREFIYTNFISWDLTQRVIKRYNRITGLNIDEERVMSLTTAFRIDELCGAIEQEYIDMTMDFLIQWMNEIT